MNKKTIGILLVIISVLCLLLLLIKPVILFPNEGGIINIYIEGIVRTIAYLLGINWMFYLGIKLLKSHSE